MRKMNAATLRLVLLVSLCHGLVHVYEHSLASVEQLIGEDASFQIEPDHQKEVSGQLGNCLRFPFGVFALLAGWMADRYGAKRLLLVYLFGCSLAAMLIGLTPQLTILYLGMFLLGVFASIYHPAGVGLISHHTTPENRPMALGYHGIFGSAGIACGPFLAGAVLHAGDLLDIEVTWRHYYFVLAVPGVLLAMLLMWRLAHTRPNVTAGEPSTNSLPDADDEAHWPSYFTLILTSGIAGFVYAAILNFLPRYLGDSGLSLADIPQRSLRNYLAGGVLLLGVIGQYSAGRLARPWTLEPLMAMAFFASAPCVLWMAYAEGTTRIVAAALFSPLFFMHQPLYNSLVAKYVPRRRRSLCYGLSFTLGFGVGSFGASFAGYAKSDLMNFGTLAGLLVLTGILSLVLWRWHGPDLDAS